MRASSQTGRSSRFTGPIAVDTSPHHLGDVPARPGHGVAWVLGTIALVSAASIGITLMVLQGDAEAPHTATSSTEVASSSTVGSSIAASPRAVSEATQEPAGPEAGPRPAARAEPEPSPEPAPSEPSPDPIDMDDAVIEVDDSEPEPSDDEPVEGSSSTAAKGPKHITQACVDRRARAEAAIAGRDWKGLLSVTSMASCWPQAEQGARRGMRVQAYADLGRFDECIAAGRGVTSPQIRAVVKTCEEQRAR